MFITVTMRAYQFIQLLFCSFFPYNTMITFDEVEVAIVRMCDEFARSVSDRDSVLLEFRPKFRYLENAIQMS